MGVDQTGPEEVPADAVGRRVSCSGERATVRYVGPVPPTAGKTAGISHDVRDVSSASFLIVSPFE